MKENFFRVALGVCLLVLFGLPAYAVKFEMTGSYEMQGRYYGNSDIVKSRVFGAKSYIGSLAVEGLSSAATLGYTVEEDPLYLGVSPYVADVEDNDAYLTQVLNLEPKIILKDEELMITADITAFSKDYQLDGDGYGRMDSAVLNGTNEDFDSYTLLRVNNIWAEALTPIGYFVFGKVPIFTGIGWFIQIPGIEEWTFGLIWSKEDEDGNDNTDDIMKWRSYNTALSTATVALDSDSADEDGIILAVIYEKENLTWQNFLIYGRSGDDNAKTASWLPNTKLTWKKDDFELEFFGTFRTGVFMNKRSNLARSYGQMFKELVTLYVNAPYKYVNLTLPLDSFEDHWYDDGYAAYLDLAYDFDGIKPRLTLAYASGADAPNKISGSFEDGLTFGTWLMNEVSDRYAMYFETPVSNNFDALGNPAVDEFYSFSNIMLARLGLEMKPTDKLDIEANLIWARRANTEYLEKWNPEWGTINAMLPDQTRIANMGQVDYDPNRPETLFGSNNKLDNKVAKDLGWEVNTTLTYQVMDNFKVAGQASYYAPGDFYESAIETAWGKAYTGLKVEPACAARWIATVTF